jgi:hypothetical protein
MQIAAQRGEIPVIWGIHRQLRNNEMLFKFESAKGPLQWKYMDIFMPEALDWLGRMCQTEGVPEVKTRGHVRVLTNFDIRRMGVWR